MEGIMQSLKITPGIKAVTIPVQMTTTDNASCEVLFLKSTRSTAVTLWITAQTKIPCPAQKHAASVPSSCTQAWNSIFTPIVRKTEIPRINTPRTRLTLFFVSLFMIGKSVFQFNLEGDIRITYGQTMYLTTFDKHTIVSVHLSQYGII